MTTCKKAFIMAIALPLTLGAASALAFGGSHGDGKYHGCGMQEGRKIFRELDLTDTQKEEMASLREVNRAAMRAQRQRQHTAMQANREQMQALMLADNFDDAAVRELVQEMSAKRVEYRIEMFEKRHQMLNVLTSEQKESYKQLQSDRMAQCAARWAEKNQ